MNKVFAFIAAFSLTALASAQENPTWIRKNAISPDGSTIAFSYKGDIYTVPVRGGQAHQVTTNAAYESEPVWTHDGKHILFSSYREDTKDIYMTTPEGGTPKQLTSFPGNETPLTVLPDGKVLFTAYNQNLMSEGFDGFPGTPQLYETDLEGSVPRLVSSMTVAALSVNRDGVVLYEDYKGYEDPLRKHHTSAVTKDIWKYVPAGTGAFTLDAKGTFTKLSTYEGEDRNPFFAADGNTFYYLSEQDGKTSNVYRCSLSDPGKSVQLTFETRNPVRFLSVSDNGVLCYSYNGDLYTLREGGKPEKVGITLYRDDDQKEMYNLSLRGGASSIAVSPNGKEIALAVRGDIFVTSVDYNTTRRITNTPEQERSVCFSKDGREIFYAAER